MNDVLPPSLPPSVTILRNFEVFLKFCVPPSLPPSPLSPSASLQKLSALGPALKRDEILVGLNFGFSPRGGRILWSLSVWLGLKCIGHYFESRGVGEMGTLYCVSALMAEFHSSKLALSRRAAAAAITNGTGFLQIQLGPKCRTHDGH